MRPRKFATLLLAGLGLLAFAVTTGPAAADTQTGKIGDPSGKSFVAACERGEALVGYAYNSAHVMMAIGPLCRPLADGAFTGPVQKLRNVYGAEDGAGNDPVVCPEKTAIARLDVFVSDRLQVHSVRGTCNPLPNGPSKGTYMRATKTTSGTAASHKSVRCEAGKYANGLVGTYDAVGGIMSLGLLCPSDEDNGPDEADRGDDDADKGGEDRGGGKKQFEEGGLSFEIDLGKGGISVGVSGGARRAKEPTTIYARPAGKEIGYLDEGERVTMVQCEDGGKGWCKISKPTAGYVWGGDFR